MATRLTDSVQQLAPELPRRARARILSASAPGMIQRSLSARICRTLFLSLLLVYGLNALILLLFTPQGEQSSVGSYGETEVIRYETLEVGFGPFAVEAAGYVNMASTEDRFYISDVLHDEHPSWERTAYSHEQFHLIQRELVIQAAGGSPSYLNPLQSIFYYSQLLRLNWELAALMPATADPLSFTGGLESSADCYAQPSGSAEAPAHYTGVYIREELCSPAQVWIVGQMAAGYWPEAPSETAMLPELFVEGGIPGRSSSILSKEEGSDRPIFRKVVFPTRRG